jgi:adenylate cyclase
VLEGSIGSDLRKDYTLLGDPVNSAARLESVTRKTGHAIVFDSRFRSLLRKERTLKKLGRYLPKGKTDQLQIFTIPEDAIKFHITSESLRKSIQSLSEPARL